VVADQAHDVTASVEASHAVVVARHGESGAEGLARLAESHVLEPLGQRENHVAVLVGHRREISIVARTRASAPATSVAFVVRQGHVRRECGEGGTGHYRAGHRAAAPEKAAPARLEDRAAFLLLRHAWISQRN
jgi:hypothetical protein